MNKQERVLAALNGNEVDHIPYSLWYHFGTQFLPAEKAADIEIVFYERYDFDFLKVMNDYSYPLPEGLDRIRTIEDWKQLKPVTVDDYCFSEQLKLLKIVAKRLKGEAFFLDTVFSPLGVARRTAKDIIFDLLRSHPEQFKQGLEIITESLCNYVKAVIEVGAAGIFFSVNGATSDLFSKEEFQEFVKPYDLQVLNAVKEIGVFNVAHVHGYNLLFDQVTDYPVHAFSWAHLHSWPSLREAKALTDKCLVGGIDEHLTNMFHPDALETQIENALHETQGQKFILGPGCAIPTDMPPEQIDLIRQAIRKS